MCLCPLVFCFFFDILKEGLELTISKGQNVLDICCYSGGFVQNASVSGATNISLVNSECTLGLSLPMTSTM